MLTLLLKFISEMTSFFDKLNILILKNRIIKTNQFLYKVVNKL